MAIDPTIALGAKAPDPPDTMGMFSKYVGVQNAMAQNRLLGIAADNQQQNLAQARQNQALQSLGTLQDNIAALSANPNTTAQDVAARSALLEATGAVPKGFSDAVIKSVPTDQAAIPQYLAQARAQVEAQRGRLQQMLYGQPQVFNNGAQQQVATVNADPGMPSAGVRPVTGGLFNNQLSPGEATAPTQIGVTPQGAPVMGTRQQFIGAAGGAAAGAASPFGTGRLPPALRNPNATSAASAPPTASNGAPAPSATPFSVPAPNPQGPGVVTGLGPAQNAALTQQGGQSAQGFQDIATQGVQARNQSAILGNMLGDTTQFTSGPGTEGWQKFQSVLNRVGVSAGISQDKLAAVDSFQKFSAQLADAQGAGSDARLAVNAAANPHAQMTPAGIDLVLRQLQGNADYLQARAKVAATYPNQSDRAGFEAAVANKLDPRAFQFARMTPAQRQSYAKSLSPADLAAVKGSYNAAYTAGLIGQ